MKASLLKLPLVVAVCLLCNEMIAQTELAPDQNPNFAVSRDKYMKIADSLNEWHSTTIQDRYKAIDWLADRKEARDQRQAFHRRLRLERASGYGYPYYSDSYYHRPSYYPRNRYGDYRHRRHHSYGWWGFNFRWP